MLLIQRRGGEEPGKPSAAFMRRIKGANSCRRDRKDKKGCEVTSSREEVIYFSVIPINNIGIL